MNRKLLYTILLPLCISHLVAQNGTRPDDSKVILKSAVIRNINVIANDNAVAGKSYQLISVFHSTTSPASDIEIAVLNTTTATYKAIHGDTRNDTFFYVARDINSATLDTNYVVVKIDDLNVDLRPGDANKDQICNNIDVLNVGIAYGRSEIAREGVYLTNDWLPLRAYDWSLTNIKSNYRYSDANGDGIVDSIGDVGTIYKNYNRQEAFTNVEYSPIGGQKFTINTLDTLYVDATSATLPIRIDLGNSTSMVNSAYGLAFTLQYNSSHFKAENIQFKPSQWFTDGEKTLNFSIINIASPNVGELDITMVRKSGKNGSGSGELGVVHIIVEDILGGIVDGINTNIEILKPVLIDSNYKILPVTIPNPKSVHIVKKSSSQIQNTKQNKSLNYMVSDRWLSVKNESPQGQEISVVNLLGKLVSKKSLNPMQDIAIDISTWSKGIYFIQSANEAFKFIIK